MKVRVFFLLIAAAAVITHPGLVRANSPKHDAKQEDGMTDAIAKERKRAAANWRSATSNEPKTNLQGWEHLAHRLIHKEGLDPQIVESVFSDKRMPERESLFFSVQPREPHNPYRRRLRRSEINNAVSFYRKNWFYFRQASLQYQVPESVILAILQIETRCGSYVGNSRVLYRLARLASAATPGNPLENFEKKRRDEQITLQQVVDRAQWLEDTFLPHLAATFRLAEHKQQHPLELRGSTAGALGLPQFLPGNYLTFGVDGNGDAIVDLFTPGDAIYSVGNFLRAHGWSAMQISNDEQREAIWHYNRSEPYITTVLKMAQQLNAPIQKIHAEIKEEILSERVREITPASFSIPGRAATVPRFIRH